MARPNPKHQSSRAQQQRSETTRAQLLAAFRQSFLDRGYGETTTGRVLAQTGLSKGALYHHFRSKTEVIEALYETEVRRTIGRAVATVDQTDPPLSRLKAACLAWTDAARDPQTSKILFEIGPSALGYEAARRIEDAISLPQIENLLMEAQNGGSISLEEPKLIALMLNALVAETALYARHSGRDVNAILASTIDALFASVSAPNL